MNKLLLTGLLALSSLAYAGSGTPKAKAKAKANSCVAACATPATPASCRPGCLPSPACPQTCKK